MKLLIDTHLLIWAATEPRRLPALAHALIDDRANELFFSAVSMWEIAVKAALGRSDFMVDVRVLRRGLLDTGYHELSMTSEHAMHVPILPLLHKDPFDRLLVSQATVEGITLLTSDGLVAQYPGPIQRV
jgi:PIN domain nuclease of toxin-antitoxin system